MPATDKQRAIAAIDLLNTARELLQSSTDQAQHDVAEDIGILLTKLESLQFFGQPLRTEWSPESARRRVGGTFGS